MKFLLPILLFATSSYANYFNNPRPIVENAFSTQIHGYYSSPEYLVLRLAAAQKTGIKQIREDFYWHDIEKSPGVFDFSRADFLVDTAAQFGITLTAIVVYGNPIYASHDNLYDSDFDADAYARYAAKLAEHFKGRIKNYEIWNEPNVYPRFFRAKTPEISAARYAIMLEKAYASIKAVNQESVVILGGLYEPQYGLGALGHFLGIPGGHYYLDMLASFNPGIENSFDVIGWHPYRYPHNAPELHSPLQPSMLHSVNTVSKKWQKPVYITEMGYHTAKHFLPFIDGVSIEDQASFLVRSFLLALSSDVDFFSWYQLAEGGAHPFQFENSFGIFSEDLQSPKPAQQAARVMFCLLGKTKYSHGESYPSIPGYDLKFETPSNDLIRVLWKQPKNKDLWAVELAADEVAYNLWGEPISDSHITPGSEPIYVLNKQRVAACT